MKKNILITGGAGFIGSALVRHCIEHLDVDILNIDKLTYAGNIHSLSDVYKSSNHRFLNLDICDTDKVSEAIKSFRPSLIMHLAAESHVDRSIDSPVDFIQTNVVGTLSMLQASRDFWESLAPGDKRKFRFHHISTDEVYGDLAPDDPAFDEGTPYKPSSPYSASKAGADHLVRSWQRTYGLPTIVTNCSNNYGPYQFPEKLIPHAILRALAGKTIPIYGDGSQVRDWLHVEDHVRALLVVAFHGEVGSTYTIGGHNEVRNLDVVKTICENLELLAPLKKIGQKSYLDLIEFVSDRPGHDRRYAINAAKIQADLNWKPQETFESGLAKTIEWYLNNQDWWRRVLDGSYRLNRLGEKG